jgi:hypothetical protein
MRSFHRVIPLSPQIVVLILSSGFMAGSMDCGWDGMTESDDNDCPFGETMIGDRVGNCVFTTEPTAEHVHVDGPPSLTLDIEPFNDLAGYTLTFEDITSGFDAQGWSLLATLPDDRFFELHVEGAPAVGPVVLGLDTANGGGFEDVPKFGPGEFYLLFGTLRVVYFEMPTRGEGRMDGVIDGFNFRSVDGTVGRGAEVEGEFSNVRIIEQPLTP